MVYAQPESILEKTIFTNPSAWAVYDTRSIIKRSLTSLNKMHKLLWDFEIQTDQLISARRPDLIIINKKERTCRIMDISVPEDHRVKLKEY